MLEKLRTAAMVFTAGAFAIACNPSVPWNGSLEDYLSARGGILEQVLRDADKHRVQIVYTRVTRDQDDRPTLKTYSYRLDGSSYFYPASTVKLPTAIAALEAIETGDRNISSTSAMLTGAAEPWQTPADTDPTTDDGLPTIAHYVRKIMLVSDNDAYNRLYEFLGPSQLRRFLEDHELRGTRITHRLEQSLTPRQNRQLNPITFQENGETVLALPTREDAVHEEPVSDILLGNAEIISGERIPGAKNFSSKNAFPLQDQHDLFQALLIPESVSRERQFSLSDGDRAMLLEAMSTPPAESGIAEYADRSRYPDGYVKFLMLGGDAPAIPGALKIFNKSGQAYGFLTDMAYFVDAQHGVEFLLGATIYTNENGVFNDDIYEYDTVGFPFMAALGKAIYELELNLTAQPLGEQD